MKKIKLVAFVLVVLSLNTVAQKSEESSSYKSAIGLRVGSPSVSASFKHFITKAGALEAYAGFQSVGYGYGYNTFTIGGQYQHHFPIGSVEGLRWYIGGGALVQFNSYGNFAGSNNYSSTFFGINAVGGVDYKFSMIPLNLSADWMPTVLLGDNYYYRRSAAGYGGISARYTFR